MSLGDDLVRPAIDIEAVHEVTADRRCQISADLLHAEAHGRDLVPVHHDCRILLIDAHIDHRREREHAALGRRLLQLIGEAQDLFMGRRGSDQELDREEARAR